MSQMVDKVPASPERGGQSLFETEEDRIKRAVDSWLFSINEAVDNLRSYMRDITRESKFMIDEFEMRVSDLSIELKPTSREPVVYEYITVSTGIAGTILLGTRRRIAVPVGITSFATKMRLYENDQRILMTGTPEAPGAATALFFEMVGHMYPHVSV